MLKLALTIFMGQGISVITQLLVPPFFLSYYARGGEAYGEWIALSASIGYLGTLNYGIQTYANNEMAILYNRGEENEAKAVQASALRLLLLIIALFVIGGLAVFYLPIASYLNLKHLDARQACLTVYLLLIQLTLGMLFTLLANSFIVVGQQHRGNYWIGAQRLVGVLALSGAVFMRASFPVLAFTQLAAALPLFVVIVVDMKHTAPILIPSLAYGNWAGTLKSLKPSGHFGLIAVAGFLTWQGPVILIQRMLGAEAVATFALVRIVFQMSRQILAVASFMIGQDITLLVGQQSWDLLRRLYDLSERVVLLLIPIVSVGTLLLCPLLFTVWLHKREFYQPTLCILMAIVSAVLGIKEHKIQFQCSSNRHEELSIFLICGYSAMLAASLFVIKEFGLPGFMAAWITWEVIQTAFILRMNAKLFPAGIRVSSRPVIYLSVFMVFAFGTALWPAYQSASWPLPTVVAVAILISTILGTAAYWIFGLEEIRLLVQNRLQRRFSPKVLAT